jgi:hypothetical protein
MTFHITSSQAPAVRNCAEPNESRQNPHTPFRFNAILQFSSPRPMYLQVFRPQFCMHFTSLPLVLQAPPFLCSRISRINVGWRIPDIPRRILSTYLTICILLQIYAFNGALLRVFQLHRYTRMYTKQVVGPVIVF